MSSIMAIKLQFISLITDRALAFLLRCLINASEFRTEGIKRFVTVGNPHEQCNLLLPLFCN